MACRKAVDPKRSRSLTPSCCGRSTCCTAYIGFRSGPTPVRNAAVPLFRRQRFELRHRAKQDCITGELEADLELPTNGLEESAANYALFSIKLLQHMPSGVPVAHRRVVLQKPVERPGERKKQDRRVRRGDLLRVLDGLREQLRLEPGQMLRPPVVTPALRCVASRRLCCET